MADILKVAEDAEGIAIWSKIFVNTSFLDVQGTRIFGNILGSPGKCIRDLWKLQQAFLLIKAGQSV